MTRGSAVALRYARALFSLSDRAEQTSELLDELDVLTEEIVGSDALRRVLFTPIHPRKERRAVIGELARRLEVCEELKAFAELLVEQNRTAQLSAIRDALRELVDRAAGRLKALVRSARPLDADELEDLRRALSRRVDAEVTLETEVDPDLIGGVVARVGGLLLDGSVRTQLEELGANLRKGSVS